MVLVLEIVLLVLTTTVCSNSTIRLVSTVKRRDVLESKRQATLKEERALRVPLEWIPRSIFSVTEWWVQL